MSVDLSVAGRAPSSLDALATKFATSRATPPRRVDENRAILRVGVDASVGGQGKRMRDVTFTTDPDAVDESMLRGFFVGWPDPPSTATHLRLLRSSHAVVLALRDERVVGFVTAVSDGVLSAYVPLLEVLPGDQGQGIGAELVRRMLVELHGLYMVDLLCDDEIAPFYERVGGFMRATGFMRRDYAAQAGRRA